MRHALNKADAVVKGMALGVRKHHRRPVSTSKAIISPQQMRSIQLVKRIFLPLLLAVLFFPPLAQAQLLSLDNLVLDNQAGRIHLRFGLRLAQTDEIQTVLQEGVDLWMFGTAKLIAKRFLLPNRVLNEHQVEHVLEWNPLAQVFEMTLPQKEHLVKNKDFDELITTHWREITMDMGEWSMLTPGQTYHLVLEISVERRDIPVWMRRVLFFWTWEVISPIHYELEFFVP